MGYNGRGRLNRTRISTSKTPRQIAEQVDRIVRLSEELDARDRERGVSRWRTRAFVGERMDRALDIMENVAWSPTLSRRGVRESGGESLHYDPAADKGMGKALREARSAG